MKRGAWHQRWCTNWAWLPALEVRELTGRATTRKPENCARRLRGGPQANPSDLAGAADQGHAVKHC